jgi:hypothetical protein
MKKTHKIVILPTDGASNLYIDNSKLKYDETAMVDDLNPIANQHLYIISDEEIKEGDWYITSDNMLLQFTKETHIHGNPLNLKGKIIATTDKSLGLPLVDQSLIKAYAEQPFDEVMVEYSDWWDDPDRTDIPVHGQIIKLKLTSNNEVIWSLPKGVIGSNKEGIIIECSEVKIDGIGHLFEFAKEHGCLTIVGDGTEIAYYPYEMISDGNYVRPGNRLYTREEVESLLFNLAEHYTMTSTKGEIEDFNNWIEENLK